jgi:hypothetical protein
MNSLAEIRLSGPSAPFAVSLPAISRHLRVLVEAARIHNQCDGKRRRCQLRPEALGGARDWLDLHGPPQL